MAILLSLVSIGNPSFSSIYTESKNSSQSYEFVKFLGDIGGGDGQFKSPRGIAIDSQDNIYVVDSLKSNVQKFDSNGNYISKWGSYGWDIGQFRNPEGIAIDSNDNIFIADSYNSRIQKFDSNGTYLDSWDVSNYFSSKPVEISIDNKDNLRVIFWYPRDIQYYDNQGNTIEASSFEGINSESNSFQATNIDTQFSPLTVINSSGYEFSINDDFETDDFNRVLIYAPVTEYAESTDDSKLNQNNEVIKSGGNKSNLYESNKNFTNLPSNNSYEFVKLFGNDELSKVNYGTPGGIAIDSMGNIYVVDSQTHHINIFDENGKFLYRWGTGGYKDGDLNWPTGIAIDSSDKVYLVDSGNNRIQKFDRFGNYITKWGSESSKGSGEGQFDGPEAITIDSNNNMYITDIYNHRVQKFDSNGNYITKWGSYGGDIGQFINPEGIVSDSKNFVYVVDSGNDRIQKFDSNGKFELQFGRSGDKEGELNSPWGIAVDSSDNIYVTDSYNYRVQKFDSQGHFLTKFGYQSSIEGGFALPQNIVVDSLGNVYVTDYEMQRIQIFSALNDSENSDESEGKTVLHNLYEPLHLEINDMSITKNKSKALVEFSVYNPNNDTMVLNNIHYYIYLQNSLLYNGTIGMVNEYRGEKSPGNYIISPNQTVILRDMEDAISNGLSTNLSPLSNSSNEFYIINGTFSYETFDEYNKMGYKPENNLIFNFTFPLDLHQTYDSTFGKEIFTPKPAHNNTVNSNDTIVGDYNPVFPPKTSRGITDQF